MKKGLHPDNYRPMVFKDTNSGFSFLTRSTAKTEETIKWEDGNEYPLLTVHISSASHPFYTGEEKIVDVEGRVDRFKARQQAAKDQSIKMANKAKKAASKQAAKPVRETTRVGGDIKSNAPKIKRPTPKPDYKKSELKTAEKPADANIAKN
jgi:large subunit ribosomal protein L31